MDNKCKKLIVLYNFFFEKGSENPLQSKNIYAIM